MRTLGTRAIPKRCVCIKALLKLVKNIVNKCMFSTQKANHRKTCKASSSRDAKSCAASSCRGAP